MLLSGQLLDQVFDVNNWMVVSDVRITQGDSPFVYFRLVNAVLDTNFKPPGRRYMPAGGAVLTATLKNVNDANTLTKTCTQPFAQDPSMWKFQVLQADGLVGTYTITLQLTEGTTITYGRVNNALAITPQSGILVPFPPQPPFIPSF
jgi:hypothetical protein